MILGKNQPKARDSKVFKKFTLSNLFIVKIVAAISPECHFFKFLEMLQPVPGVQIVGSGAT